MTELPSDTPPILEIHLQLSQYPILAQQIRKRMREEIYRRGVTTSERFENEARDKAIKSQRREGMMNPLDEEDAEQWERRLQQIREYLTDFYFAYNLPLDLLQRLIDEAIAQRLPGGEGGTRLMFNPELAPLDFILRKAQEYEELPAERLEKVRHHLEEIIVVLTKTMISDQLHFVRLAKAWFTATDFRYIQARRIGAGKIGGKAAGMLLAWKVLQSAAPHLAYQIQIPRSYFIGADVFYDFLSLNDIEYLNQKYKPAEEIIADYPAIEEAYAQAELPPGVTSRLRQILREVGKRPLIVRSSSLLEDNFGMSFAGKYQSFFCPNQATPEENLAALTLAIRRVYASVHNPDALLYRRRMGLLDYDERMAILLQEVQGQAYHDYFFPAVAGVAFSFAPIVWNSRLRREEGFVRMVTGLGTRAVERVGEDYPRLVTLSHPLLRPEVSPSAIRRYSQRLMDVIDFQKNELTTLPVQQVLDWRYPPLRWLASADKGDTLLPIFSLGPELAAEQLLPTFDNLLQRTNFVPFLKEVLATLQQQYGLPVDMEFALSLESGAKQAEITFHLLQCRPQSTTNGEAASSAPLDLVEADRFFLAQRMVPNGRVSEIDYLVYVDPLAYGNLPTPTQKREVARCVGRLNKALEKHVFMLIGPGRWGSANLDLGVPVTYADIFNARALVELAVAHKGITPEPSYGTHFFQDLVESRIYPLALYPDDGQDKLNQAFLDEAGNQLATLLPRDAGLADCVKVIHIPSVRQGQVMELRMDGKTGLAYFTSAAALT
ncbi:PEP/pyruvate-binding domain-containing protein [Candidatus Amarolinea aalborgensis]|uniref:PEP/pyruvate-binding domain-containing protein n=1 Tax=Candidatus Amarolinea aalborgensis TaxID=2249329 RepID=UPI003BF9D71F